MSMISEQVKELRELAKGARNTGMLFPNWRYKTLKQAADTIESLSVKLQAANMERPAEDCSWWVPCNVENLTNKEVLCCDNHGEMILGYVFEDETSDTGFSAESDHEYMYGCVKQEFPDVLKK